MDNISAIGARVQRVPVIPAASHTVFPIERTERVIRDRQTGRTVSYDQYDLSPAALAKAREHYKASELAMCDTCECVHRRGPCPLMEPETRDPDPAALDWIEHRADWDPGVLRRNHIAIALFILGALAGWITCGLLF